MEQTCQDEELESILKRWKDDAIETTKRRIKIAGAAIALLTVTQYITEGCKKMTQYELDRKQFAEQDYGLVGYQLDPPSLTQTYVSADGDTLTKTYEFQFRGFEER